MTYVSLGFYPFLVLLLLVYYIMPLRFRWLILLAGSVGFYILLSGEGFLLLLLTIFLSYGAGLLLAFLREKQNKPVFLQKMVLTVSVLAVMTPWFLIKNGSFLWGNTIFGRIVPLGISFYTLQIVSYLADVHSGRIAAQKNPAKYALFVLFFPQIVQGPIPRYAQLAQQLYSGHLFDEKKFVKGMQLILWGFFLKFMIADRASIVVNLIFDNPSQYMGCYVLTAGALYSIELYADFLSCVTISQGIAGLFGIDLTDNFLRPYLATSIKDFWRRWHISLSAWLRDYIYIPLGGSRKGKIRKYGNLLITFVFSGIWHGSGYKFLFWGMMHAAFQVVGDLTAPIKSRCYRLLRLSEESGTRRMIQRIGVFFWVTLAWIIFRADSLRSGLEMIKNLFSTWNPWIFVDGSLLHLEVSGKEWCVLMLSILILFFVDHLQEKGIPIRDGILKKAVYVRWTLYIAVILCIMLFGVYGYGYQTQDFIYGGF